MPWPQALTDLLGPAYALILSPENANDVKAAALLLQRSGHMCGLLGEKGNNASSLRQSLRRAGTSAAMSSRCIGDDQQRNRERRCSENAFCRPGTSAARHLL